VKLDELRRLEGYSRFEELLKTLFQFEFADLDFGIYRVFRQRRQVVEQYFAQKLPQRLSAYLEGLAASSRGALEDDLRRTKDRLRELAPALMDAETGSLDGQAEQVAEAMGGEVADTIRTWRSQEEQLKDYTLAEGQINQVLLLLTDFFGRYYQEGDFMPLPKFGRREEYALDSFPGASYRVEDPFFHWATRGLHYVKTDRFLKDYAFERGSESLEEKTYEVTESPRVYRRLG